jgi:hypothetical protein
VSRTLVKSWPHREPLPEGREALERAIGLCESRAQWPLLLATRDGWRVCNPRNVCDKAYRGDADESVAVEDLAGWLPERYRDMTVAQLRDELAGSAS